MKDEEIREIFESTYPHLDLTREKPRIGFFGESLPGGFYSVDDNETLWSGFRTGYNIGAESRQSEIDFFKNMHNQQVKYLQDLGILKPTFKSHAVDIACIIDAYQKNVNKQIDQLEAEIADIKGDDKV